MLIACFFFFFVKTHLNANIAFMCRAKAPLLWQITCQGRLGSLVKHGLPFKQCVCISKILALELNAKERAHLSHILQMLCCRCYIDATTDVESIDPEDSVMQ